MCEFIFVILFLNQDPLKLHSGIVMRQKEYVEVRDKLTDEYLRQVQKTYPAATGADSECRPLLGEKEYQSI